MKPETYRKKIIECAPGTFYLPINKLIPKNSQFELVRWTRNGSRVHGISRDHEGHEFDWEESVRASLEVVLDECEIPL